MNTHKDNAAFQALVARLQAANASRPPTPARLRRRPNRFFDLLQDDPAPPSQPIKDWRLKGVVTAVKQQGDCGSCGSFATSAAIETLLRIRDPNDTTDVDAGFMHTCTVLGAESDCRTSADLQPVLDAVCANGYAAACGQILYPYPANRCGGVALRPVNHYIELGGNNAVKNALMLGPIVAEIYAWPDFTKYHGQTAFYSPDGNGDWYQHSVCVVGFNSNGWIIKNSFGPTWGVGGFVVIAYGTCGLFGGAPAGELPGQLFSLSLPA